MRENQRRERAHLAEKHGRQDNGEERLHGFNGVSKGNRDFPEAHVSKEITKSVHNCKWQDGRKLSRVNQISMSE